MKKTGGKETSREVSPWVSGFLPRFPAFQIFHSSWTHRSGKPCTSDFRKRFRLRLCGCAGFFVVRKDVGGHFSFSLIGISYFGGKFWGGFKVEFLQLWPFDLKNSKGKYQWNEFFGTQMMLMSCSSFTTLHKKLLCCTVFFKQVKSVKFDHSLLLNVCFGMILYVILYQILLLVLQQNSPLDVSQTYEPFKSFGIPINLLMTKTTKKGDVIFLMNHQNGWLSWWLTKKRGILT